MNSGVSEYRVDLRVRNNWLLRRMAECGLRTGAELARVAGISQPAAYNLINLKQAPIGKTGVLLSAARKICKSLGKSPEELWPPQHLEFPLSNNRASIELTATDVAALLERDHDAGPEALLVDARSIENGIGLALERLSPKQREIVVRRFGLEGHEPETLEQIAESFGVNRERVRQIEQTAIRKARWALKHRRIESMQDLGLPALLCDSRKTKEKQEHDPSA